MSDHVVHDGGVSFADVPSTAVISANKRHSPNAVSMLAHRLRRWTNIQTALGECLVFAVMFRTNASSGIELARILCNYIC